MGQTLHRPGCTPIYASPYASEAHLNRCRPSCRASARLDDVWFQDDAGIEAKSLELSRFGGLRGIKAREDIPVGDSIASVSLESTLLVQPFKRSPFKDFCSDKQWKQSPWYLKMALMLLYERNVLGSASRVTHYIHDLEAIDIDTPVAWSEAEVAELQYPHLQEEIRKQKATWNELYENVASASSKRICREDLLWAMQAVRSRAFSGPYSGARLSTRALQFVVLLGVGAYFLVLAHTPIEKVLNAGIAAVLFNIMYDALLSRRLKWFAMIPVIDYCNHSSEIKSEVSFEVFRERFVATVSTPIAKGDQVEISYGKHKNDYLLQYYGFSLRNLPADTYTIDVGDRLDSISKQAPTVLVLNRKGLAAESTAWLQDSEDRRAAYKKIIELAEAEQGAWASSLEGDQRRLGNDTDGSRMKSILQFRTEKKGILLRSLQQLRQKAGKKLESRPDSTFAKHR